MTSPAKESSRPNIIAGLVLLILTLQVYTNSILRSKCVGFITGHSNLQISYFGCWPLKPTVRQYWINCTFKNL